MIPASHVRRRDERLARLLDERSRLIRIARAWPPAAIMLFDVQMEIDAIVNSLRMEVRR